MCCLGPAEQKQCHTRDLPAYGQLGLVEEGRIIPGPGRISHRTLVGLDTSDKSDSGGLDGSGIKINEAGTGADGRRPVLGGLTADAVLFLQGQRAQAFPGAAIKMPQIGDGPPQRCRRDLKQQHPTFGPDHLMDGSDGVAIGELLSDLAF